MVMHLCKLIQRNCKCDTAVIAFAAGATQLKLPEINLDSLCVETSVASKVCGGTVRLNFLKGKGSGRSDACGGWCKYSKRIYWG